MITAHCLSSNDDDDEMNVKNSRPTSPASAPLCPLRGTTSVNKLDNKYNQQTCGSPRGR